MKKRSEQPSTSMVYARLTPEEKTALEALLAKTPGVNYLSGLVTQLVVSKLVEADLLDSGDSGTVTLTVSKAELRYIEMAVGLLVQPGQYFMNGEILPPEKARVLLERIEAL